MEQKKNDKVHEIDLGSTPEDVPYRVFESSMARSDLRHKRMCIIVVVIAAMLFVSNMAWLYVWQSYDFIDENISLDSNDGGNANYLGGNGDINNGISKSGETDENEAER